MIRIFVLLLTILLVGCESRSTHNFKPSAGLVPDEKTAISIAEAVWIPIYGKETVDSEKPLKAHLEGDVWIVQGTLHAGTGSRGGSAIAEISRTDGRVLRISHGM
jgi:hypothetical protein